ncbi:MAG: leucine--tRNA ligase [Patescibacteria group bacterium]|nr:leucine--tRNA ligase [Patescibacteria group bacterium]
MKKTNSVPKYNFKTIERKWQKRWERDKTFQPDMVLAKKPFYNLMMFPYPSAEGLHVGNMYAFAGADTFGRYKKLCGYDVFEPIGLDGFGIHSENYAMKIGEHIRSVSERSEKNFYKQLRGIGNMYDWSRTVETYKPNYYKWTQWLFLQMFKNGLVYQKKAEVNWCPSCKTVLSDEQVIQGQCERCDSFVEKKELKQWFFRITKYADKLLKNLKWIDWPEDIKTNQRNWIGRSEGAIINFPVKNSNYSLKVFTTRPDTLFGATYMVIAPEHALIENRESRIENYGEVEKYVKKAIGRSEQDRKNDERNKTGIELKGIKAINPATKKPIPIWVADYVLAGYGTGAIMAVPAHDQRDWESAKKFGLEIKCVVNPEDYRLAGKNTQEDPQKILEEILKGERCYEWRGKAMNSGQFDGLETIEFKKEITKWLVKNKLGKRSVDYKLRDWCISRQRYWGPPIPIVWCQNCALNKMPKNKKPKVLIIHGFEGSSSRNWFPWIKKEFEKMGCEVFAPDISDSFHPNVETWMEDLKPFIRKLNENSIIIGHSLGSKAAMHLLERMDRKVAKVFFVASAIGNPKRSWKTMEKMFAGSDIRSLKKFWEYKINWDKINNSLDEAHFIISSNDKLVDPKHYKIAKLNNVHIETWKGQGHFTQSKNEMLRDYIFEKTFTNFEAVPVPEKDLPVKLPPMEDFLPEGRGKGPLAKNEEFVNVKCPVCGKPAKRETDVSDPFVDSSWYFFRYPSTEFDDQPFDKKRTKKWLPVDSYIGGKEHTVLHLLYSRFITMALKDLGHIDFEEPYKRFFGHGLITKDGAKMSKSKGNVVNPDDMIDKYGADTLRLYLRFIGDFGQGGDWRNSGIRGMNKFVRRMWTVFFAITGDGDGIKNMSMVDKTIKIVGEDIDSLSFNTAVARLMEYVNWLRENNSLFDEAQAKKVKETLSFVIAPMTPHIAEEMWETLGNKTSIFTHRWPKYDKNNIIDEEIELVVQVNGKVRDKLKVSRDISEEEAKSIALESEKAQKYISGKKVKRIIYVQGKLVSIVM